MAEAVSDQVRIQIDQAALRLIQADITMLDVDAFVFYAQHNLALGAGFGSAISVRGGPSVQKELDALGPLETGQVVVTDAGKLQATSIVHAVGPRFNEDGLEEKLRATVLESLKAAEEKGAKRIAFPPMGTGFYMIPLDLCARVMLETIKSYLEGETAIQEVLICVGDRREFEPFRARVESLN